MKHALIVAHPSQASFTLAAAHAYAEAARKHEHDVVFRDLYVMGFDPCLAPDEIPGPSGAHPHDDVMAERALIGDADVFAFFYPLWLNVPPAILEGYRQRVFGFGFAYCSRRGGGTDPMLTAARMIAFTSSGAPADWMEKSGAMEAIRQLSDEHFAAVCGLKIADHVHFGGITAGLRADAVEQCLQRVRVAVQTNF
jgi:NAD(P)H dehydrogenase (quinone)